MKALVATRSVAPSPSANPSSERAPLVGAAQLAAELGVSRDWVYEHSVELGALRLGSGPKARLRFDPVAARAALSCYGSERSMSPIASVDAESERSPRRRRRSLAAGRPEPGAILPIRERPRRRRKAVDRAAE